MVDMTQKTWNIRLRKSYTSTLESKIARTFTDDRDIFHGMNLRHGVSVVEYRPGQRDDDCRRVYGMYLPL